MTSHLVSKSKRAQSIKNYKKLDRTYYLEELTPLKAIHIFCKKDSFNVGDTVRDCGGKDCAFYKYRMGKLNGDSEKDVLDTIRNYCINECCDGKEMMEKICEGDHCPLYHYRYGTNPKRQEAAKEKDNLQLKQKEEKEPVGVTE